MRSLRVCISRCLIEVIIDAKCTYNRAPVPRLPRLRLHRKPRPCYLLAHQLYCEEGEDGFTWFVSQYSRSCFCTTGTSSSSMFASSSPLPSLYTDATRIRFGHDEMATIRLTYLAPPRRCTCRRLFLRMNYMKNEHIVMSYLKVMTCLRLTQHEMALRRPIYHLRNRKAGARRPSSCSQQRWRRRYHFVHHV